MSKIFQKLIIISIFFVLSTGLLKAQDAEGEPWWSITVITEGNGLYEVWGGNVDYSSEKDFANSYYNINDRKLRYRKLGSSNKTRKFRGKFRYYVIVSNNALHPVYVDAIEGNDGTYYYGDKVTGNCEDNENYMGEPDGKTTKVGIYGQTKKGFYDGFILIKNPVTKGLPSR